MAFAEHEVRLRRRTYKSKCFAKKRTLDAAQYICAATGESVARRRLRECMRADVLLDFKLLLKISETNLLHFLTAVIVMQSLPNVEYHDTHRKSKKVKKRNETKK